MPVISWSCTIHDLELPTSPSLRVRREAVFKGLLIGLTSRILLFLTVLVGLANADSFPQGTSQEFPHQLWLDGWVRWDSGWYGSIAENGYIEPEDIRQGEMRNTAFLPLYPMLMRVLAPVTGGPFLAGLLISNLSFLIALVLLWALIEFKFDRTVATKTIILMAFNPYSLFFSSVYTESLFLALVVGAFFLAERSQWVPAFLLAGLAAATRVTGIFVGLALIILYFRRHRSRQEILCRRTWALALCIVPLLLHLVFLYQRYGTPFEFVWAQYEGWGRTELYLPSTSTEWRQFLFLVVALVFSAGAVPAMGPAYGAWAILTSLAAWFKWTSGGRLVLVVFPATAMLAKALRSNFLFGGVLAYYLYYMLRLALRFAQGQWVA